MKYEEPRLVNIKNLSKELLSSNLNIKINALLYLFMHNIDMDLAILWLEKCLQDKNREILRIGILGVSHMAKSYPFIDFKYLRKLLNNVHDTMLEGYLNDAYADLDIYEKARENLHAAFK